MTITTYDPLDKAFLSVMATQHVPMTSGGGHAAMRSFMESPAFIDHLADALHAADENLATAVIEFDCYCRRIATADGTKDGPQDPNWSYDGKQYDPAEWGVTDPPRCEQTAADIVARMLHR